MLVHRQSDTAEKPAEKLSCCNHGGTWRSQRSLCAACHCCSRLWRFSSSCVVVDISLAFKSVGVGRGVGGGEGEEDCFFLCWKWSSDFCDDVFSAMEQNPDGGAIMIVWCSVGGENGACREWATALEPAICQGGPPPMTRTPDYSHWCFSPLASLAVALWEYRDFYGWMYCGRFSAVVVLEHKQTLSRLHRECCVYPPVCLSLFARQVVKSVYFWSRCPSCM